MHMLRKLFTPRYQEPEGLDTATFFGDQAPVDEATLPDATSEESLAMQPPSPDASDGKDPVDDDDATPAATDTKGVPLGALQEERTKRQQAQDRQRELEQQNTTLLERMNKFLMEQQQAAQPQQQPEVEQIPDFIDDPVGHIEGLKAQFGREMTALREQLVGNTQYQQQQAQHHQLVQQVVVRENEFRAATPDYDAAVDHFRAMKANEYAVLGLNELQIQQQLAKDSTGLAQVALSRNQNPAEVLYSMAKALGYKAAQGSGSQQPTQQPAPSKAPPTSLSNLPAAGRAPDEKGRVTAKDIASMSNEDFDKFFENMKGESVQRPAY